jgi:HD-GYP domain-containing protein (c-di-GMP phosphodiesterase class II)
MLARHDSPRTDQQLRLSDVLAALTAALDLTEGHVPGHSARSCFLAMHIAEELRLPAEQQSELFYSALLKDVGCSSNAARVCEIYGADDILLKHDYELLDSTNLLVCAKYVIEHTGPNDPWARRLVRLVRLAIHGRDWQRQVETTRCERGASIVRKLGFGEPVAAAVYHVGEAWDGKGQPDGLKGEDVPLYSRIVAVAQTVDIFAKAGAGSALSILRARSGHALDPQMVDTFCRVADRERSGLWQHLTIEDRASLIGAREPKGFEIEADDDRLDSVTAAFAEVIDAKSPFTGRHSYNVALVAEAMALGLKLSPTECQAIRRASLVHDLGKLGVSNLILDKRGELSEAEWRVMRRHPEATLEIVSRVPALQDVAELASRHHERLDGRGYFRGLRGEQLSLSARLIAVADVWEALTAERPYRKALQPDEALAEMDGMVGWHLGREAYEALRRVL